MKRPVLLVLAFAWVLALTAFLARTAIQFKGLRTAFAPVAERAAIESGDEPYHRFLLAVEAAMPDAPVGGKADTRHVLILVRDPGRNDTFHFYRAVYMLYPVRVMFVPVNFSPPAGGKFAVGVDPGLAGLVREWKVSVAGFYETENLNRGSVLSVTVLRDGRLSFASLPAKPAEPEESVLWRMGYGPSRPVRWLAGLAALLLTGLAFNYAAGLARAFGIEGVLALGLVTGAGLTAWWMTLLSLAGVKWSLPVAVIPGMLAAAAAVVAWRKRSVPALESAAPAPMEWFDRAGLALFGLAVLIAAIFSVIPLSAWSNWDAWAIWFLKAKVFRVARAVDLGFLRERAYAFSHHDYPPGLPAIQNYLMLWTGGLDVRLLRCLSPVYLAALGGLLAALLRELGMRRGRWLATGAFTLIPFVLGQGSNGYADVPLAVGMVACLLLLVSALGGRAPAWAIGLIGGFAALTKDEGFLWSLACLTVLGVCDLVKREKWTRIAVAAGVLLAVAGPWKAVTRRLDLKPNDYVINLPAMLGNVPERAPMVVKGLFLETLGPGVTMPALAGAESPGPALAGWFENQVSKWLLVWYLVLASVVFGARRLIRPPVSFAAAVIIMQACAYGSVYLASIVSVPWHIVTSLDRLLLQLLPSVFAVACAILVPANGRTESDKVARVKGAGK